MESGFCVNEDLLLENLSNKSLAGQRIVAHSLAERRGIGALASWKIPKDCLKYMREANEKYKGKLEEQRMEEAFRLQRKRKALEKDDAIKALEKQKQELLSNFAVLSREINPIH